MTRVLKEVRDGALLLLAMLIISGGVILVSFMFFTDEDRFVNNSEVIEQPITLTLDNTVNFRLPFTRESVGNLIAELTRLDSTLPSDYPIYLTLSTPGGSVIAGMELYAFIAGMNRPVHTITFFAASMGFQTVQQLGERYIVSSGVLMSHQASGGFEGEFSHGNSQLDSRYALWLDIVREMDEQTVRRSNGKQTLDSYRKAYSHELWLTGREAVKQGYADAIGIVSCHKEMVNQTETISVMTIFGKIEGTIPKCPMDKRVLKVEVLVQTSRGLLPLGQLKKENPALITCAQKKMTGASGLIGDDVPCVLNANTTESTIDSELKKATDLLLGNVRDQIAITN